MKKQTTPAVQGIGAYTARQQSVEHRKACATTLRMRIRSAINPVGVDPRMDWRGMIHHRAQGVIGDLIGYVK